MNPRLALPLLAATLISACGPPTKTPVAPVAAYPDRILNAHAVDYTTCFTDTPLEDTQSPTARGGPGETAQQALVAIDSSGSMAAQAAGNSRMEIAKAAVQAFVRSLPDDSRVGLAVFGHAGANTPAAKTASCSAGARQLVAPTTDRAQLDAALPAIQPTGWTPLAAAIRTGGASLGDGGNEPRILYVVSDGLETCGGDPVAEAHALNKGARKVIVNVIAFGVPTADQAELRAVADAGGGSFVVARDTESLRRALQEAAEASLRGAFVNTASTRAHNVVAVGGSVSRATQCVRIGLDRERAAALAAIAADEKAGRASSEETGAARSLINGRGAKALNALVAYSEAQGSAERNRASALWRRFEAAEAQLKPAS